MLSTTQYCIDVTRHYNLKCNLQYLAIRCEEHQYIHNETFSNQHYTLLLVSLSLSPPRNATHRCTLHTKQRQLKSLVLASLAHVPVPQPLELAALLVHQRLGGVILPHIAAVHDADLGAVYDGVQAVCDGEHGHVLELGANHLLDEVVGLGVDGGSGLVHHQDLGLAEQRAANADQLSLSGGEVVASLGHELGQLVGQAQHMLLHVHVREHLPDVIVAVLVEGVQIEANAGAEHHGVLRDDAQLVAQQVQAHTRDVDVVDQDLATNQVLNAEQRHHQGGLAAAGAASNTHMVVAVDLEAHALKHQRAVSVAHHGILELHHGERDTDSRRAMAVFALRK
eukprot:Colp12_sorted_trinity150504_noHs@3126